MGMKKDKALPPASVRNRIERLAKANPDAGFIAVRQDDAKLPELTAAHNLAAITGKPVPLVVLGHQVMVMPPEH
jgi:hypothetical protein